MYCPFCDNVSDLIVVEYKKPAGSSLDVWAMNCEPMDIYTTEGAVRCPHCNGQNLILDTEEGVQCPRCKEGVLRGEMEWIS